ncbi:MAG TPA: hypothetical protein DEU95_15840 [Chloroflexi bacterium]|jgi:hypothetical protein|nr:hypothetical protein [Chloroflexota bacterium]HBY46630.1 hypothetical protein [Chloroflexota bacterium]HCG31129.1 hypothetical protein [Chloroflexota bacterium]
MVTGSVRLTTEAGRWLPEILIPIVAAPELGFADQNHVVQLASSGMQAPSGAGDPTVLEVTTRAALSFDHPDTPTAIIFSNGAFVRRICNMRVPKNAFPMVTGLCVDHYRNRHR